MGGGWGLLRAGRAPFLDLGASYKSIFVKIISHILMMSTIFLFVGYISTKISSLKAAASGEQEYKK